MSHHLPEGWRWASLSQLLSLVSRVEPVAANKTYALGGVRLYASGVHIHETLDGKQIKTPLLSRVASHDVMYNKMWASKGSFGVAHEQHDGIYVTAEYPQFTANPLILDVEYLEQFFHSRRF
jgi:type I restriction enzyme S subunit